MFQTILLHLSNAIILLTAIIGFVNYRYLGRAWRILHLLVVITFFNEITAYCLIKYRHAQNLWLYNIYILPNLLLLVLTASLLTRLRWLSVLSVAGILLCGSIWSYQVYHSGMNILFHYALLTSCILLVICYLTVLMQTIAGSGQQNRQSVILVSIAVLLYYGCNIPLFSFFNYFVAKQGNKIAWNIYIINNLLSVTFYSLLLSAFVLLRRSARNPKALA